MTKQEFQALFERALDLAAQHAERQVGREVPRAYVIEISMTRYKDQLLPVREATDALYLGEELSYRIIDVGVRAVNRKTTTCWVRPSGHQPAPYEKTWNDPPGWGPFKQIIFQHIRVEDE